MKYNREKIMRTAWKLVKEYGKNLSEALKMAWTLAKAFVELREKDGVEPEEGKITYRFWFGYGRKRAYFERSWVSNFQNKKGYYVDLETGYVRL